MSKQEEVMLSLLFVKRTYEEYARMLQEVIDNPVLKTLDDSACEKLIGLLTGAVKVPNQQDKK
jgi:hypothetical protein